MAAIPPQLDLSVLPPVFVLSSHLTTDQLHDIEDQLLEHNAPLTYDIAEARLVLGKVGTKKRAEFELRARKIWTEEVMPPRPVVKKSRSDSEGSITSPSKRRKLIRRGAEKSNERGEQGSTTEDEEGGRVDSQMPVKLRFGAKNSFATKTIVIEDSTTEDESQLNQKRICEVPTAMKRSVDPAVDVTPNDSSDTIRVLRLSWLDACLETNSILPTKEYTIYEGCFKEGQDPLKSPPRPKTFKPAPLRTSPISQHRLAERPMGSMILERAKADAGAGLVNSQVAHYEAAPHGARTMGRASGPPVFNRSNAHLISHPKLLETTTSEYEGNDSEIPAPPAWVKQQIKYACQRSTPFDTPNEAFIVELKKIRLARELIADEIGVRAYGTFIAAIAAYPYQIVNPKEILRLPGCDIKLANLWIEWKNSGGKIKAAEDAETDPVLVNLKLFYDIWGVGATTARDFYNDKGWRDLDDVVEYGWNTLNRVQQIGVKYYDEFQKGIPRSEVESIAEKVREHAIKVCDGGIELMVVGGYRRGKQESGDVDMIVSHRHLEKTANLVQDIVESLEKEGWITHTLSLSLTSTHRNQSTLPFKSADVGSRGSGFDTLDKALVVWQDPFWPTQAADLAANPKVKNPNIHRRVDIIVSPWRTVGCAVAGWTSGTTFQRDLRRYAKYQKNWKFDSSGVRDRQTGVVVKLEGEEGVSGSIVDAEKAVFEGFELVYREPWERCTG